MRVEVLNIIDNSTIKVVSIIRKQHPKYKKFINVKKKYLVDSNNVDVIVGDKVEIVASRPISKRKRWKILNVIK
jgi:small subunit ribosomal protein S17|tara:strand:- start:18673 stop:18894 length:222 start_codon:yes stop_codon:yes gene_type:complete